MSEREPDGSPSRGGYVFVGPKPTMAYVFQVVAELNAGPGPVVVKARGIAIAKAVDVAEVVRRRLLEGQVEVGAISIATERLTNHEGRGANVSTIAIPLRLTAAAKPAAAGPAGAPAAPPT